MPRIFLSMVFGVLLFVVSIHAQSDVSRFQKQHDTKFNKKNLTSIQVNLIEALENENANMKASAIQTLRELEIVFPEESFESMLKPLIKIVKDENGESTVRILALFALENLHSDVGDAAILDLQYTTSNKTIREICSAMSVADMIAKEKQVNLNMFK